MEQVQALDDISGGVAAGASPRQRDSEAQRARRRIRQVEAMIADLERSANDLDRDIDAEEKRTRISDPNHFAYSTFAKSLLVRRDNLRRSARELGGELARLCAGLEALGRTAA